MPRVAAHVLLLISLLVLLCVGPASAVLETPFIAIDVGTDWVKTAALRVSSGGGSNNDLAQPSASVEIVLNDQSNRKSPPCVAFRAMNAAPVTPNASHAGRVERSVAEEALQLAARFPTQVICSPALLLGHKATHIANNTLVEDFAVSLGPLHSGRRDALSVNLTLRADLQQTYSAEEMTAMVLEYSKRMAEKAAQESNRITHEDEARLRERYYGTTNKISRSSSSKYDDSVEKAHDVVRYAALTVPVTATAAERQASLDAAALAGLRVVRLVHGVTAAAMQLAYLKHEQLLDQTVTSGSEANKAETRYVMIYDMGSRHTTAAVFSYSPGSSSTAATTSLTGSTPSSTRSGVKAVVALRAVASATGFGGRSFDHCIAHYWDRTFLHNQTFAPLTSQASLTAQREYYKRRGSLLRAAARAREMLSVNSIASITVDGVTLPDSGSAFTTRMTRDELRRECETLFVRALRVRDEALARAGLSAVDGLSRLEVIGGATRMPLLLQRLQQHIYSDEDVQSSETGEHGVSIGRTLNADEAVALGAVQLASHQARRVGGPRFIVQEPLFYDIALQLLPTLTRAHPQDTVSEKAAESTSTGVVTPPLHVVFAAQQTSVPSLKTVRLANRTSDFLLRLLAPPITTSTSSTPSSVTNDDTSYGEGAKVREDDFCRIATGGQCYVQEHLITNVDKAVAQAVNQTTLVEEGRSVDEAGQLLRTRSQLSLNTTEVVLEVAVSESQLPYVHKAYLRAIYTRHTRSTPLIVPVNNNNTMSSSNATNATDVNETNTTLNESNSTTSESSNNDSNSTTEDVSVEEQEENGPREEDNNNDEEGDNNNASSDSSDLNATETSASLQGEEGVNVTTSTTVRVFALSVRRVQCHQDVIRDALLTSTHVNISHGVNMLCEEAAQSRQMLRALRQADAERLERSTLRNELEMILLAFKSSPEWDKESEKVEECTEKDKVNCSDAAVQDIMQWRNVVREAELWLENMADTAPLPELAAWHVRLHRLQTNFNKREAVGEYNDEHVSQHEPNAAPQDDDTSDL